MKTLIATAIIVAATGGISFAANLNPDRDPTRGFEKTNPVSSEHTASVRAIEVPMQIQVNRPYNTEDGRAPWAGNN